MTASQVIAADSRVMQTITRHLESLRQSADGDELYGLISRTTRRHSRNGPLGRDYLLDLYTQLETFAQDAVALPTMRIRARLLQQHIASYISDIKLAPLPETPPGATPATQASVANSSVNAAPSPALSRARGRERVGDGSAAVEGVLERPGEKAENETHKRSERFRTLMRSQDDAWKAIYGTVKDYQRLKDAWTKSLDELARQRDALESKLAQTTRQLSQLEVEHDKLRTRLQNVSIEPRKRARVPAAPRLLRGIQLAKRDGFVRSLEAEIKRIKRSGAPLALGLIGIENLETLVEQHGAEAATAVQRCYAEEILSNFRAYDLVAAYDRGQYAVMFPDTSKEGARRALEKAYKRALETHLNYGGRSIPLPSFASALITYAAGEDPARFLGRADEALNQARESGSRGVVLS